MVVALIALFVALGGPAQAKKQLLEGGLLRKNTVTGRAIKNGTVAKADLTKGAVRSLMATPARSVRSAQIVDGQVLAPDLGAGSVGQAQLAAGAVTASKLAPDSVGGGSVANGSLQTVDIGSFTGSVQRRRLLRVRHRSKCQARRGRGDADRRAAQHRRRRRRRLTAGVVAGHHHRHRQAGAGQHDPDHRLLDRAGGGATPLRHPARRSFAT